MYKINQMHMLYDTSSELRSYIQGSVIIYVEVLLLMFGFYKVSMLFRKKK